MESIDISYISLFVGLLMLAIPFFCLYRFKTGLLKSAIVAVVRMIVQLFLVGIYLKFLFQWNNPLVNFLWVFIMIFVAGQTAIKRIRMKASVLFIPLYIGFLTSVALIGLYFLGFVLRLDNVFNARYFIPIFGIIMGNMLSSNVIALNAYYDGLQREQQLYRYLLGNGAGRFEAQIPFIRSAMIKSFSPNIANIAVMGLVALPGTMIGQILGGSSPNVAIKYQMMIMVITFTASMLSLIITILLARRKSFDAYGMLKKDIRVG
jgi:putative ABC transport system permease protein